MIQGTVSYLIDLRAGVETLTVLDGQAHASSAEPIGRCEYALTHDLPQLQVDIARSSNKLNISRLMLRWRVAQRLESPSRTWTCLDRATGLRLTEASVSMVGYLGFVNGHAKLDSLVGLDPSDEALLLSRSGKDVGGGQGTRHRIVHASVGWVKNLARQGAQPHGV